MIQRIQTIYLLLTAIISAALFYIPLFESTKAFLITDNAFLLIMNIGIGSLSFLSIFLFKNRNLQIRACRLCMILIILLVGLFFFTSDTIASSVDKKVIFKIGAYLPLIQIALVFLAQRSISKDEELIRSADRLR